MKMVLVQCSQVSHSSNLQQGLLGGDAGLCHVSCAHRPAAWLWVLIRTWRFPAGGTSWGTLQGSGAWTDVGTGTKPCGCCGEAGSWSELCGLWLSSPQCLGTREGSGWDLAGRVSRLLEMQQGQCHCLFARMLVGLWCPSSRLHSSFCARM